MTYKWIIALPLCLILAYAAGQASAAQAAVEAADSDSWEAQVEELGGTVEFKSAGDEQSWDAAQQGMPLQAGDMLRTGEDGSAKLVLDGEAVVEIGSSTMLTVEGLEYSKSGLSMEHGSLLGKIKDLFSRKRQFAVRTPAAVCAVRGTEFAVEHSLENDETVAGVFDDGEIAVGKPDAKEADFVSLKGGREAVIEKRTARIQAEMMRRLDRRKERMLRLRTELPRFRAGWKRLGIKERQIRRNDLLRRRAAIKAHKAGAAQKRAAVRAQAKERRARIAEQRPNRPSAGQPRHNAMPKANKPPRQSGKQAQPGGQRRPPR